MTHWKLAVAGIAMLAMSRPIPSADKVKASLPGDQSAAVAPKPRRVWADRSANTLGAPSFDGQYLSYVDPATGNLALRELSTGKSRMLTRKKSPSEEGQFAYFSTISRDTRQVAYAWFNEEGFYDLRVVEITENGALAPPRVLYRNAEAGFVQPCSWSPDGKQILTLFFRKDNISQIALVDAADGGVKVLKSLQWIYPKRMDFSPDGRSIVYDNLGESGGEERDIFLLSVDGSRETRIVEDPATDLFPLWSPDGESVAFTSDRGGAMRAWAVPINAGEAAGPPVVLSGELGRPLPLGFTAKGDYYYGRRSGAVDVKVARLDLATGTLSGTAVNASLRFPGRNTAPAWSADGKRLAYLTRRGSENYGQDSRFITVLSIDTGDERELNPRLAHIERLTWSPDGNSLLVSGADRRSRGGLFLVDAETAETETLLLDIDSGFRGPEAAWAADGKAVYFVRGEGGDGASLMLRSIEPHEGQVVYRAEDRRIGHLKSSPAGRWLAFTQSDSEGREVTLYAFDTREKKLRKFIPLPAEGLESVSWSFDGNGILVGVMQAGHSELWQIPLEGGGARKLRLPEGWNAEVSPHPDGHRVAFTAGRDFEEVWVIENLAAALPKVH